MGNRAMFRMLDRITSDMRGINGRALQLGKSLEEVKQQLNRAEERKAAKRPGRKK